MNAKQRRFVAEYLKDLNATQAALRAGYSRKTAYSQGHDLLKHPEVSAAVAAAQRDREARTAITQDWVLTRLKAESELTAAEGGTQAGRVAALNLIAKHLGMLADRLKVEEVERVEIVVEVVDGNPPGESQPPPQAG